VQIDLIGEPSIAGSVGGREIVEHHGRSVGQNDPLPDEQRTVLAEGDDTVVFADEPGALRDEQMAAGDAVEESVAVANDYGSNRPGMESP